MRFAVLAIVFLSQTSAVESLSTTTWPGLILAMIGGSAGVAVIHKIIAEHLREKREDARRLADEEKLRREVKYKAEADEHAAIVALARSLPNHLAEVSKSNESVARELRDAVAILARGQADHAKELTEIRREMSDGTRAQVRAIAEKLGIQTSTDETNINRRASSPGQPHAQLP